VDVLLLMFWLQEHGGCIEYSGFFWSWVRVIILKGLKRYASFHQTL